MKWKRKLMSFIKFCKLFNYKIKKIRIFDFFDRDKKGFLTYWDFFAK